MSRKWFSIIALVAAAISLLSVSSCGNKQELVSIAIQPGVETFGATNIPVIDDAGLNVQLRALGTYVHPPVTKDITNQVTWASNTPQMVTVNSTGLIAATGDACGGTLISATVQTNADAGGLSASGAVVTGFMTANVVCFTGTGGGGGGEPTLTLNFSGLGTGTVTVSPSGFSCASTNVTCTTSFPSGTTVTLTAAPVGSSSFGGWSGGCTGSGACIIVLQSNITVTATFN
jgi:Divergent InlB B-repeat domain/Bacterial Ig-like domain (group 2)